MRVQDSYEPVVTNASTFPSKYLRDSFRTHSLSSLSILFLAFQHGVSDRLSSWLEKRR